jgi:hypothetical protein
VAAGWASADAPRALVEVDPPTFADAGGRAGPLVAARTRPVERLVVGDLSLPVAINAYTGGPPDWPARAARAPQPPEELVDALQDRPHQDKGRLRRATYLTKTRKK